MSARDKAKRPGLRVADRARYAAAPHKRRLKENARRARLQGVECSLTKAEWLEILEVFDYRCAYCLRADRPLCQEHIIPISKGGGHTAENIVPSCRPCNSTKGNRGPLVLVNAAT